MELVLKLWPRLGGPCGGVVLGPRSGESGGLCRTGMWLLRLALAGLRVDRLIDCPWPWPPAGAAEVAA